MAPPPHGPISARRLLLLGAGIALLAAAWIGPLPALAMTRFWAHMTMHLAVVALAAPLIAAALAGSRFDPVARAPVLFAPLPAAFLEFVVIWGWHAPAAHDAARMRPEVFVVEQASFLGVGLLVWMSAIGGARAGRRERAPGGVAALLLTAMHMSLLGALLALAPRPLYEACLGPDDQQIGGVMMLAVGGSVYLIGALVLLPRVLDEPARP
ncbi:cytochrome c oxidase assembly protein [Salinarimonas chemoclinalis]|uniref:cytochrome c oxidase assembly protein n=1 Tax=Salinarimonas chemoclinalis TaxID=3241599 RepID=UPI003556BE1C